MLCKDLNYGLGLSPIILAYQFGAHMKNMRIAHHTWEDDKWVAKMERKIMANVRLLQIYENSPLATRLLLSVKYASSINWVLPNVGLMCASRLSLGLPMSDNCPNIVARV